MTLGWEPLWRKHGAQWELQPPEPRVVELVRLLKEEGGRRVLDLGCGLGRHLLLLAAEGFETYGIDVSPTAVATCRPRPREAGLPAAVPPGAAASIPQVPTPARPAGRASTARAKDATWAPPVNPPRSAARC